MRGCVPNRITISVHACSYTRTRVSDGAGAYCSQPCSERAVAPAQSATATATMIMLIFAGFLATRGASRIKFGNGKKDGDGKNSGAEQQLVTDTVGPYRHGHAKCGCSYSGSRGGAIFDSRAAAESDKGRGSNQFY